MRPASQSASTKPGLHGPFILLNRTSSSTWHAARQPERESLKEARYMQVMKMYASSESIRQLINSRLHLYGEAADWHISRTVVL